jgi:hypothetical protein
MTDDRERDDEGLPRPADGMIFWLVIAILIVGAAGSWTIAKWGGINAAAETSNQ